MTPNTLHRLKQLLDAGNVAAAKKLVQAEIDKKKQRRFEKGLRQGGLVNPR